MTRKWPLPLLLLALGAPPGCAPPPAPRPQPPAPAAQAPAVPTAAPPSAHREDVVDLARFFASAEAAGTFVVVDRQAGRTLRHDPERARTRFLPASTFKIPNSLIALETGVASGADFPLAWDSKAVPRQPYWPDAWAQDHTLQSAFRSSVVWYYQELARRIGPERMQRYVRQFDYGNQDISGGQDMFWLKGGLRISADEQVAFLQRLYDGKLGVSERSTAIMKEIMILEDTPAYRLSGKTGTADVTETKELGWLVGYLERGKDVYFYALNMEGERVWEEWPPAKRAALVREILTELGLIPRDGARPPR